MIIATAGHVDHGKSTLVRALTGVDPDRLVEEKRRGMTIDLGFAELGLPSGRRAGVVDVPGHARFIGNMLAGVHGVDLLLVVIAADEGIMPQTVEHLEIARLMEARTTVVALTKVDAVEADWLREMTREVAAALPAQGIADAEIVPVSALTGEGLPELIAAVDTRLQESLQDGRVRLPIDRVFTLDGHGTVVTGTLIGAELVNGQEVQLAPTRLTARIRALHQHGLAVERALPGTRVAVNLLGLERAQVARGMVLTAAGEGMSSRRVDVTIRVLPAGSRGVKHGDEVLVHTGTSETPARVVLLADDLIAPGAAGLAQLVLGRPLAALNGDRIVVRLPSPATTLGGGILLDVSPARHVRHDAEVIRALEHRAGGEMAASVREELAKHPHGILAPALWGNFAISRSAAVAVEPSAIGATIRGGRWFSFAAWSGLCARAEALLARHHEQFPMRPGMPRQELLSRLSLAAPGLGAVIDAMLAEDRLSARGGDLALPSHRAGTAITPSAERLLDLFTAAGLTPPSVADALSESQAGPEILQGLVATGCLVRLSPEVVMEVSAYDRAVAAVRSLAEAEGSVTVASVRDHLGASRRPILALLEHLDARRVTRREGDRRTLRTG